MLVGLSVLERVWGEGGEGRRRDRQTATLRQTASQPDRHSDRNRETVRV